MYTAEYNKDGSLRHSMDCKMAFGRKDVNCPRCAEMLSGAPTRSGWQSGYFETKKRQVEVEKASRAAHFAPDGPHATGKCGPVCTAFDW